MSPANANTAELRQERRYRVDQAVQVTVLGGPEQTLDGRIEDISRSGMRLRLDRPAAFGALLKVEWEGHLQLGSVRYSVETGSGSFVGLQLFPSWEALARDILAREAERIERSNADLQHFAYAVSHDLTEHLRMITCYLQLLERRYQGKLDSDADEFIHYAIDGAQKMRDSLQGLLTYSWATRGGMESHPVSSEMVLRQAMINLKDDIRRSGAVITHDLLPGVIGHLPQLVQLFQNLLSNALKFRGETPPRIHISARRENGEWIFSVRDNGIGIDAQYLERIFGTFQRLHTKADIPGTGLGLATCKMILQRHGGRIWAESESGQGSVFRFALPISSWESHG